MEDLLDVQLARYKKQVDNGKLSPSTYQGYAKSLNSVRMQYWHGKDVEEVTPAAMRAWVSEMDCTSKAIRNMLIPIRSVFEDALNDGIITNNPFDQIALIKLIRQTSKASDYVIQPFTHEERQQILSACRTDEFPMFQFWFNKGLRPGELQALEWRHIDFDKATARIEQNQVAGVKDTKDRCRYPHSGSECRGHGSPARSKTHQLAKGWSHLSEPRNDGAMADRCADQKELVATADEARRHRVPQPVPNPAHLRFHPTDRWR